MTVACRGGCGITPALQAAEGGREKLWLAEPEPPKGAMAGGRTRTRTLDPLIKSQLLYQLSYAP